MMSVSIRLMTITIARQLISRNFWELRRQSTQNVVDTSGVELTNEFGLKLEVPRTIWVHFWRNFWGKFWRWCGLCQPSDFWEHDDWFLFCDPGRTCERRPLISRNFFFFLKSWQKLFGAHPGLLNMIRAQSRTHWFDGIFLGYEVATRSSIWRNFGKIWDLTTEGKLARSSTDHFDLRC